MPMLDERSMWDVVRETETERGEVLLRYGA